jgi:hypothetical protein
VRNWVAQLHETTGKIIGIFIFIIDKTLAYALETSTLTKRDRKQLSIFERKVYRGILGPVYNKEKENWRLLTNEEVYAMVKNPTIAPIRGSVEMQEEHKRVKWNSTLIEI